MRDPEKRAYLVCLRNNCEASIAEVEQARNRAVGNEVVRTLVFTVRKLQCQCRVLNREVT